MAASKSQNPSRVMAHQPGGLFTIQKYVLFIVTLFSVSRIWGFIVKLFTPSQNVVALSVALPLKRLSNIRCNCKSLNPSGAEAGISQTNLVTIIAVDGLVSQGERASTAMILARDKQSRIFHAEEFQRDLGVEKWQKMQMYFHVY